MIQTEEFHAQPSLGNISDAPNIVSTKMNTTFTSRSPNKSPSVTTGTSERWKCLPCLCQRALKCKWKLQKLLAIALLSVKHSVSHLPPLIPVLSSRLLLPPLASHHDLLPGIRVCHQITISLFSSWFSGSAILAVLVQSAVFFFPP